MKTVSTDDTDPEVVAAIAIPPPKDKAFAKKIDGCLTRPIISLLLIPLIIGVVAALVQTWPDIIGLFNPSNPEQTQSITQPTPSSPIIVALRDLDIRNGPDAEFSTVSILSMGNSLDILGISEDRLWYQILLQDGRTGWVLATSTGARLEGDRGVVNVIIPTLTPSNTPTYTPTATNTPTPSNTPTHTPTNTEVFISSPTPTATSVISPNTPVPALTATNTISTESHSYPCETTIIERASESTTLYIIYASPSENLQPTASVYSGSRVIILDDTLLLGRKWYQIEYGNENAIGWIWDSYIEPSVTCP